MNQHRLAEYQQRRARAAASQASGERKAFFLANLRLVTFFGAGTLAVLAATHRISALGWWGALGLAGAFVAVAIIHGRIIADLQRSRLLVQINERGVARLEDRWQTFAHQGTRFQDPDHLYAGDLDLFGPHSLFQLLDVTTNTFGEEQLANWLKTPAEVDEVEKRQKTVAELASQVDFRQALEVEGLMLAQRKTDPSSLLEWARTPMQFTHQAAWRGLAYALPAITAGLWLLSHFHLFENKLWIVPLVVQIIIAIFIKRRTASIYQKADVSSGKLFCYEQVFQLLERSQPVSPLWKELNRQITVDGAPVSAMMRRLGRAVEFMRIRQQPLLHLPLALLTLWDLHWALALERWRQACGSHLEQWLNVLGKMEALSSLANFAFDHPEYVFATVKSQGESDGTDGPTNGSLLHAQELGHPLLPTAGRVTNDVILSGPGSVLFITGSNMSGKTTFLRTLGINTVLALAGAPVCAHAFCVSKLQVCTSMRVHDSLAQGLSLFYAELKRLKKVVDVCRGQPALFLLDEVLQGTNTAERQAASRAIIKQLVHNGAVGAIASHDLGLTSLENETGGRVRNLHFTDHIEDGKMVFDFRIRQGVVTTTNALALLKQVGIEVEL